LYRYTGTTGEQRRTVTRENVKCGATVRLFCTDTYAGSGALLRQSQRKVQGSLLWDVEVHTTGSATFRLEPFGTDRVTSTRTETRAHWHEEQKEFLVCQYVQWCRYEPGRKVANGDLITGTLKGGDAYGVQLVVKARGQRHNIRKGLRRKYQDQ